VQLARVSIGGLDVPASLLDRGTALDLLSRYLKHDGAGQFEYAGAGFDPRPGETNLGSPNVIDDSDVLSLTLLSIRLDGHHVLEITRYRRAEISQLLADVPTDIHIEHAAARQLLQPDAAAWQLWELLREIGKADTAPSLGPVAAGKLLARKRPNLIPIADSHTARAFVRTAPRRDKRWWDNVHAAAVESTVPACQTTSLWRYLESLKSELGAAHLPTLRVLDILAWMWAENP
jgi:hypothetical protein